MDENKLNEMLGRFVGDLGATITAGGVVIGHRLGLYRALADGPGTADELAADRLRPAVRRGVAARPGRRWLRQLRRGTDTWSLTEEQAFVLANPDGAVYAPGAYVLALGSLQASTGSRRRTRTGAGHGWHEHDDEVFVGASSSSARATWPTWCRPGSRHSTACSPSSRPARRSPTSGAAWARRHPARREFPKLQLMGCDYHEESIELARKRAADAGVAERIAFERRARRTSAARTTTWWRRWTACTTWATRSGRPATSGSRWPRTAPG